MDSRNNDPKNIEDVQIETNNDPQGDPKLSIANSSPTEPPSSTTMPQTSRWSRLKAFLATHRTRAIIAAAVIVIAPVAAWAFFFNNKPAAPAAKPKAKVETKPAAPTTKASLLTGVELEPALADRAIRAVVIENHTEARPQSGMSQAGVVYEALAEGGITRFLTFYGEGQPPSIGPVRSLRPYFNHWTLEFNSPIAHAGGSAEALGQVPLLNVKSMNALGGGVGQFFTRASDRYAPHNLYTSSAALDQLLQTRGYANPPQFTPNARKKDQPPTTPAHTIIGINYSYASFQVEYRYNQGCNCYDRFMAGAPHVDRNTGAQIQVKNVVVQYMSVNYDNTGHAIMGLLGSGKTIVFRDGGAVEGTWNKPTYESRSKLLDAGGKEIPLNRGNTWYSIVPADRAVSF